MSVRGTARAADVAKGTVLKLLADAGTAFRAYQDEVLRDLPCRRFQVDEIWSYVYAGVRRVSCPLSPRGGDGLGDLVDRAYRVVPRGGLP